VNSEKKEASKLILKTMAHELSELYCTLLSFIYEEKHKNFRLEGYKEGSSGNTWGCIRMEFMTKLYLSSLSCQWWEDINKNKQCCVFTYIRNCSFL
jgi:hypothetical protein